MTSRVKLRRSNRPASIRAGNRNGRRRAAMACAGLLCAAPAAAQPDTWLADFARQMRAAAEAASPPADDAPVTAGVASDVQGNGDASITTTATGLIDVHARGTPIPALIEMLSYEFRTNIVATGSVNESVSANLYAVTLDEALEAILRPRGYAFKREGKVIYVGRPEELTSLLPPPETRVFMLNYLSRKDAERAVAALLSPVGKVVGEEDEEARGIGGTTEVAVEKNASVSYLIVTDYPDRLRRVERLLRDLDTRPLQVLIEATILRATLNEDNQFGIDFTLLGGVDFQNVGSTSNATNDLTTGPLRPDDLQETTLNINTRFVGTLPGGFSFGIIKDNIAAFVRALEDITDVTVVANPKIVALNRQEAEVIVGRRDGYLTTTVTETAAVQTVEFLETGTQVRLRPIINADGTVRLEVHPKDSNGGLTVDNLPFEETTEAHAQIIVEDGHTVLIGGLFRERTVSAESQIPVLGDIPFGGLLFKSTLDQTIREEVVILLTVHVLRNTAEQSEWAEGVREDIERVRVGSRRGLLGTGRERLAQAFYQEAIAQYERGEYDRALLNVRMSLHNNPAHLPALKLKEQLLGRRLWESDGAQSRTLVLELLGQQGRRGADFGRPAIEWDLQTVDTPSPLLAPSGAIPPAQAPAGCAAGSRTPPTSQPAPRGPAVRVEDVP